MEYFEIYDELGRPLGKAPRKEVHQKGILHKSVNIVIERSNGDLLIQLRSKNKDVCPDTWDFGVCEHLKPGESFEEAALRGLREELGVTKCSVKSVGTPMISKVDNPELKIKDFEFQQCFTAKCESRFYMDEKEVAAIRWISPGKLKKEMSQNTTRFTPWFREFIERELLT